MAVSHLVAQSDGWPSGGLWMNGLDLLKINWLRVCLCKYVCVFGKISTTELDYVSLNLCFQFVAAVNEMNKLNVKHFRPFFHLRATVADLVALINKFHCVYFVSSYAWLTC